MTPRAKIEALLFVAGEEGVTLSDLSLLSELTLTACQQQLEALRTDYAKNKLSALTIIQTADKYRLTTKEELAPVLQSYAKTAVNQSLSKSAVEVLSIVAYKQPITRLEIDTLRGVNSSSILSNLRLHGLIESKGQLEAPGRPTLYGTTEFFLDFLGINRLDELPPTISIDETDVEAFPELFGTATLENEESFDENK
ncbi:MAG: SMC-Scp complex subunit ScpB [Streptococcaceae bacterium]|jgi:segregation and condensation protein B|nr:SMC-Scp complex subunit ScpB [Streptococcaceae bacterium]